MAQIFLEKASDIAEIDKTVKNKFKLEWLTEKDPHGDFYSDWVRKPKHTGYAYCIHCAQYIYHGSSGKQTLLSHATSNKHIRTRNTLATNQSLPASLDPCSSSTPDSSLPHGIAPDVSVSNSSMVLPAPPLTNVSTNDRMFHNEAATVAFAKEHRLPLSFIPYLREYGDFYARDYNMFKRMKISRASATYKLEGLGDALHTKLIYDLKKSFFCINLDECTNKAKNHILEVLVQYYSEDDNAVVCKHYKAFDIIYVNANSVFQIVHDQLVKDEIPLTNIIASLSDSAAYMRAQVEGFEAKLRGVATNLVDIGGDSCHKIHNVVKIFCGFFDNTWAEKLCDDIYNDMDFSCDIRKHLQDLCKHVTCEKYHKPKERIQHSWMSLLDCINNLLEMISSLSLLYWAWLPAETRKNESLLMQYERLKPDSITNQQAKVIHAIHVEVAIRGDRDAGRARRIRIAEQLWLRRTQTLTYMYFYSSTLAEFNKYIKTFQTSKPMIHIIHDGQERLLKYFLALFIDPVTVNQTNDLENLDLHTANKKPLEDMVVGHRCKKILKTLPPDHPCRREFLQNVQKAYTETAIYFKTRFANCKVLKHCSSLDPAALGHQLTHQSQMKLLLEDFPHILKGDEYDEYEREVVHMQVDSKLPPWDNEKELDEWWSEVFKGGKYPCISKIVKAALCIITSPRVEQIFSEMNHTVSSEKTRTSIDTLNSTHAVTSFVKSKKNIEGPYKSTSLNIFYRKDLLKSPVDHLICSSLQNAHSAHKLKAKEKKTKNADTVDSCAPNPSSAMDKKRKRMADLFPEANPAKKCKRSEKPHKKPKAMGKDKSKTKDISVTKRKRWAPSKDVVIRLCNEVFQHRNSPSIPKPVIEEATSTLGVESSEAEDLLLSLRGLIKNALYKGSTDPSDIVQLFPADFHKNLRDLLGKIIIENLPKWKEMAVNNLVSLPRLVDFDWRVDVKTSSDAVSRMAVPSCILQLQVQENATTTNSMPPQKNINVELSQETLETMLDGLGKIRDQLSSVAKKT